MNIRKLTLLMVSLAMLLSACHKDLGDYDINMPGTPQVTNLDSVYMANVGDSLIIKPTISNVDGAEIELQWRISVINGPELNFVGPALRTIFGLEAKRYQARLTVYNKTNGMKYFHNFFIEGATDFAAGTAVLSIEDGTTQLSFVKPDGSVQARLYRAIHGEDLPSNPKNLFLLRNRFTNNSIMGYWIITKNGGVALDANTMLLNPKYPNSLKDNFFLAPDEIEVGSIVAHPQGVMMGIINGSFYGGTTNTWDQSNTYGMFGLPSEGDYQLASSFVMNFSQVNGQTFNYFIAFDKNRKQFLRFNFYGGPMYFGTQYSVNSTSIFDPINVGLDLVQMIQLNGDDTFAYCKAADGQLYELKFNVEFNGPFTFKPQHKRLFIRPDLINEDTKWQGANNGVIYIASGTKVYRYNPLNQEVRELVTNFGGKKITMIKISDDQESLMVGTEGTIYFVNIGVGQYGTFIKKIEGIPGTVVDMTIR
ncbi:PKD-like family lipoprotein [Pedobacter sp. BAL39]|uniref:PKD-like family lipoprotein n=1 Tax=Pedobacter sp. BAL39 TaxID=391596 RepID=UPI0012FC1DDA|nr:PKD-like family lipoprotein [Pedobacter sp. BAL39]